MTQSMYVPSSGLRRSAERETYSSESAGARARSTSTQALDRAGAGTLFPAKSQLISLLLIFHPVLIKVKGGLYQLSYIKLI